MMGRHSLDNADQGGQKGIGIPKGVAARIPADDAGDRYHYTEHAAQIGARFGAVDGGPDQDGGQGQGGGEHAHPNQRACD